MIYTAARRACAWVFFCPGLAYGLFTSRLPAVKLHANLDEAEIGMALLALGGSCLVMLMMLPKLLSRWSVKEVILGALIGLAIGLLIAMSAQNLVWLVIGCIITGLTIGLTDGAMNVLGERFERESGKPTMSYFHAFYSMGAVTASVLGFTVAALSGGPCLNTAIGIAAMSLLMLTQVKAIPGGDRDPQAQPKGQKDKLRLSDLPMMLLVLGLMTTCAYASEGAVGEWSALYLVEQGAPESWAALVYGCFSVAVTMVRLVVDKIRMLLQDSVIVFSGMLIAASGLGLALYTESILLSYVGFLLFGFGFAPVSPILFSYAGRVPGISSSRGVSIVALFSYSGLLIIPPCIGTLAKATNLSTALSVVFILIAIIGIGSRLLKRKASGEPKEWAT